MGVRRYCCASPACAYSNPSLSRSAYGKHKRQMLSQEKRVGRYISHAPARHLKWCSTTIFWLTTNEARCCQMLDMTLREKPKRLGFAVMIKGFLGTDPYQCILCKSRIRLAGTMASYHVTRLLSDRLSSDGEKR